MHRIALRCQDIATGQPVEQPHAERRLQRRDPAQHRGMIDAQYPRRRRQRPMPRHGQEKPQIVPVVLCIHADDLCKFR
jgi:hypothetical protein